jgi:uncharacterized membrane protein
MFFNRHVKPFLTETEIASVLACVRANEDGTSGEIRICIERRCPYMDPLDRARELFYQLKMYETTHRNAVLIYISHLDKDFALFGDGAIYEKAEKDFWQKEAKRLSYHFFHHEEAKGIATCVQHVGDMLRIHFPFEGIKKNELPDEIVFGK